MGMEISTESRHIEFPAAVLYEHETKVLEYYAQPCELRLELIDDSTGEIRKIKHFPDFLEIREDGLLLEEWKSEVKLNKLAQQYPYRYRKGTDGLWYSPQIERHLAEIGLRYRIRSDQELNRRYVENLLHLAAYFHPAAEPCSAATLNRLKAVLDLHGCLYLNELTLEPYGFVMDEILKAIADRTVIADLEREDLTNPRRCRLYRDSTLMEFVAGKVAEKSFPGLEKFAFVVATGTQFSYESQVFTIVLLGESEVVCRSADGETINLSRQWLLESHAKNKIRPIGSPQTQTIDISRYSKEQLDIALRRQKLLEVFPEKSVVSDRTLRRWMARQNGAVVNGGHEVLALVPNTPARGNRTSRLSKEQELLINDVIERTWRTNAARNYSSCYQELRVRCNEAGMEAPSLGTFIARVKASQRPGDNRVRLGKRMAYQLSGFVDVLYYDTPTHGSRPFQYCHIDHTQIDIEVISSRTGKSLGRPWLTFVVDSFTRRILALYLTFDAPSYHSVMMVMRDLVRRHHRLPEFVVVDNGKDFASTAFETFLQVMGVHLRFRPSGQPRHGAVLERVFGSVHTEYIHNLAGNTKCMKHVRMTTGKHLPANFAEWTLEALYYGISHWAFEFYDQERHPTLDCSPREAFEKGLLEGGHRSHLQILPNEDFLIATCPPVDRVGTRQVHRQHGVKVNGLQYRAPEFSDSRVAGKSLPVRYDPWDASVVYAQIEQRWVKAVCKNLIGLGQLTEDERKVLTQEYINQSGGLGDDARSQQRLREFMQVFTPEGALADALERQQENKRLYNRLKLSNVFEVAPMQELSLTEDTSLYAAVATSRPMTSSNSLKEPTEATAPPPVFEDF
ncbi:MAG: integrase [Rhodocyclaceae bacterium]|nr:integrase [Rhodocyclaceae bacterium]